MPDMPEKLDILTLDGCGVRADAESEHMLKWREMKREKYKSKTERFEERF